MDQFLLYITCASKEEAKRLAQTLLEERLIACANILTEIESMYWWKGAIQADTEALLLAKTSDRHRETVVDRVRELHSYECPCVVAIKIEYGNRDFLRWIETETDGSS